MWDRLQVGKEGGEDKCTLMGPLRPPCSTQWDITPLQMPFWSASILEKSPLILPVSIHPSTRPPAYHSSNRFPGLFLHTGQAQCSVRSIFMNKTDLSSGLVELKAG